MPTRSVTFIEGSLLFDLLKRKSNLITFDKESVHLTKVLDFVKQNIISHKLFEPTNPYILNLNLELEEALGVKYLHETELLDLVISHVPLESRWASVFFEKEFSRWAYPEDSGYPSWVTDYRSLDTFIVWQPTLANTSLVLPTEKLTKFVTTFSRTKKSQTTFRFKSILKCVSSYLLKNKYRLTDLRNAKVFKLVGDPLCEALELTYLHTSQIRTVLSNRVMKLPR